MKSVVIEINNNTDAKEFRKVISFVSEEIMSYSMDGYKIELQLTDEANEKDIGEEIRRLADKYISVNTNSEVIFNNVIGDRCYHPELVTGTEDQSIFYLCDGMIGLKENAIFIFRYFDKIFSYFAILRGALEKIYPVLLPMDTYKKTGYLEKSPQYSIFCCSANENIQQLEHINTTVGKEEMKELMHVPEYALSPSACFHTYLELQDQILPENTLITFQQSVFRSEGRLNYKEIGRLRDYHVREIVMVGSQEYVSDMRQTILQEVIAFAKAINLAGNITIASDPFIMPKMQKYKKFQIIDKSKFEMHLNCTKEEEISVASFNLHGTAFTHPFNIKVDQCEDTVTACIGFGLERWVIAFVCQYGLNVDEWPELIRNEYINHYSKNK